MLVVERGILVCKLKKIINQIQKLVATVQADAAERPFGLRLLLQVQSFCCLCSQTMALWASSNLVDRWEHPNRRTAFSTSMPLARYFVPTSAGLDWPETFFNTSSSRLMMSWIHRLCVSMWRILPAPRRAATPMAAGLSVCDCMPRATTTNTTTTAATTATSTTTKIFSHLYA